MSITVTLTRACQCGGSMRVTTSSVEAMRDFDAAFDRFHTGDGHGPAEVDEHAGEDR